jgi:DNA (cytosine-5)-methyltransferase 1
VAVLEDGTELFTPIGEPPYDPVEDRGYVILRSCAAASSDKSSAGVSAPAESVLRAASEPNRQRRPRYLSIFTGAGGLDIGLEHAGFECVGCVEIDADARRTLIANRPEWRVVEPGDLQAWAPAELLRCVDLRPGELELLASGPPCQPFSKAGWWRREAGRLVDPRARTLDALMDLVEHALPEVLLIENVPGIAYAGSDDGLRLVAHRLQTINQEHGTAYEPVALPINAADFGIPQRRERMLVVAVRDGRRVALPQPTHGPHSPRQLPAVTAWHAIRRVEEPTGSELAALAPGGKWGALLPSIPAGNNYLWHTDRGGGLPLFGWRRRYWSFLLKLAPDQPAWTLPSNPGPATGPFHWENRHLSRGEIAALQCFPADYAITGSYRAALRQLGNAVPCALGELIGLEFRRQLHGRRVRRSLRLAPSDADIPPAPPEPCPVPAEYISLAGIHAPHPGPGEGPGVADRRRRTAEFTRRHAASDGSIAA